MKKYVKPVLLYENFELSQHVADCQWELQSGNEKVCYATGDPEWGCDENTKSFLPDSSVCVTKVEEDYCYTNGNTNYALFKS